MDSDTITTSTIKVTTAPDARTSTDKHATALFSGYFTNLDDGFNNSSTVATSGSCWTITRGNDAAGIGAITTEALDSNTTTAGKLTLAGILSSDTTDTVNDTQPQVSKSLENAGAFGMTIKIDTLAGGSTDWFNLAISKTSAYTSGLTNNIDASSFSYQPGTNNNNTFTEEASVITACSDCFSATSVYHCITNSADGTTRTLSYDEGATGTYTTLASSLTQPTLTGEIAADFRFAYDGTSQFTSTIDWVRFNIGEASCPPVSRVE